MMVWFFPSLSPMPIYYQGIRVTVIEPPCNHSYRNVYTLQCSMSPMLHSAYTHFSTKLQLSQKYTNVSKLELSSIISLHLGHSISISNSDNTGFSFCSDKPDSSGASRLCFSGDRMFCVTSLVRACLDMVVLIRIDYYIPADSEVGESGVHADFFLSLTREL